MILLFAKALIAGLIIAAPTGPTGILCIKRTVLEKDKSGFVTGYGAATADLFYAAIAGFGVTIISDFLIAKQGWFQLIGGIALLVLGIRELLVSREHHHKKLNKKNHLFKDFISGVLVTLSNPITILTFFAVYAIIGLQEDHRTIHSVILVAGSFIGSLIGWTAVNIAARFYGGRMGKNALSKITKISGLILIVFGTLLLSKVLNII